MKKIKTKIAERIADDPRFTEAQLAEVHKVALERGFTEFKAENGRTIYLDEEITDGVEILMFDNECVWLDVYVRDREESIKAESDGTAEAISELIATMQKK